MGFSVLKQGFEPLICAGDAYTRGKTQGEQLKKQIALCLNAFYQSPLYLQIRNPRLPRRWADYILHARAKKHIFESLKRLPEQHRFLEGMAEGSKQPLQRFLLFCAIESLLSSQSQAPQMMACSMVLVPPRFSSTGDAMLIKNTDAPYFLKSFNILRSSLPTTGLKNLALTLNAQSGSHTGMNEKGLAITYNTAHGPTKSKGKIPLSLHIQEALQQCESASSAVEWLKNRSYEGGGIMGIMDAKNIFLLEVYGDEVAAEHIENKVLTASNHYQLMPQYNPPAQSYYTNQSIKSLHGTRVMASSEARLDRLNELTGTRVHFHPQDLLEYVKDHGHRQLPNDETLCRHGHFYETTGSILLMPARREVQFTLGSPCESNYVSYQWY